MLICSLLPLRSNMNTTFILSFAPSAPTTWQPKAKSVNEREICNLRVSASYSLQIQNLDYLCHQEDLQKATDELASYKRECGSLTKSLADKEAQIRDLQTLLQEDAYRIQDLTNKCSSLAVELEKLEQDKSLQTELHQKEVSFLKSSMEAELSESQREHERALHQKMSRFLLSHLETEPVPCRSNFRN